MGGPFEDMIFGGLLDGHALIVECGAFRIESHEAHSDYVRRRVNITERSSNVWVPAEVEDAEAYVLRCLSVILPPPPKPGE